MIRELFRRQKLSALNHHRYLLYAGLNKIPVLEVKKPASILA
jgi:hypothetical protein